MNKILKCKSLQLSLLLLISFVFIFYTKSSGGAVSALFAIASGIVSSTVGLVVYVISTFWPFLLISSILVFLLAKLRNLIQSLIK